MKVVMTLKNGLILELPLDSREELNEVHQRIHAFGTFLEWKGRIWVKKKEIASYEVVDAPLKIDETI